MNPAPITLSHGAILDAYRNIDPIFLNTPQFELAALSDAFGVRLILKVETLNPIRSFKGRGTDYFVQRRSEGAFVCASAGNFGQGMAYACQKRKVALTVFAAENANPLKLERMRYLGAQVKPAGADFDAAKAAAKTYASTHGLVYAEDGRETEVSVGAGTLGLELSRYHAPIDAVLIPLGNGALLNGVGTWFRTESPETKIIGVVARDAPAMALSWREKRLVTTATAVTIADGIAVREPVPEALESMKTVVDDVVEVSEDGLLEAMKLVHEKVGLVLEPAGAAGVAAVLEGVKTFGAVLATPLCGGNLTPEQIRRWL